MNRNEVKVVMAIMEVSYPHWMMKQTDESMKIMLDLWSELLAEDNAQHVIRAVKTIIQTDIREYPPNIAQIRTKVYDMTHDADTSENEAWGLVMKALKNSIHHSIEEYAKLPKDVQMVVTAEQLKEWAQIEVDQLNTVIASNFMRSYKGRKASFKQDAILPESARTEIEGFKERLAEEKENMRIEINDKGDESEDE